MEERDPDNILSIVLLDDDAAFAAEMEETLFFQVHKSFIVNLDRVQVLRAAEVIMDDGAAVPVSRRFRKQTAGIFFARLAAETRG